MGKHDSPDPAAALARQVAEVTLERAASALASLGWEPLIRPDRLVVGRPTFTAAVWVDYDRPLMLVVDVTDRVPVAFDHGRPLATFLNLWNHEQVGPVASYRLNDAGDFTVRLRHGIHIRHGLSDEQLIAELGDAFDHATSFVVHLRDRFLEIGFDVPLPPTLTRALDHAALTGRHPSHRHLPAGERREVLGAPDVYEGPPGGDSAGGATEPVGVDAIEGVLQALSFSYKRADGVLATGANGVPFAMSIDGGTPDADRYARVTAMWNSGLDAVADFLPTWLVCNDLNERNTNVRVYLHEYDGLLHVHAESTCLIAEGLTEDQLGGFVVSSLLACLSAIDHVSSQVAGQSAVSWPAT